MREYSTSEASDLTGLPAHRIRAWAHRGLLQPRRTKQGHFRFSFADLVVMRTGRELAAAGLAPGRVTRLLSQLGERLPEGQSLSKIRVIVQDDRVLIRDKLHQWEPDSGQVALDFNVGQLAAQVAPLILAHQPGHRPRSAQDWYEWGIDQELADAEAAAENAYREAIKADPRHANAKINLGRLLHKRGSVAVAEALYRDAVKADPKSTLAAFNLGVALEDQSRWEEAVVAYRQALDIDTTLADAHFNLARLLERLGQTQEAIRHLSAFKRLTS